MTVSQIFIEKAKKNSKIETLFPYEEFLGFYEKLTELNHAKKVDIYIFMIENLNFIGKIFKNKLWKLFFIKIYLNTNFSDESNQNSIENIFDVIDELLKHHFVHNISYDVICRLPNSKLSILQQLFDYQRKNLYDFQFLSLYGMLETKHTLFFIRNLADYIYKDFQNLSIDCNKKIFIFHKDHKFWDIILKFPLDQIYKESPNFTKDSDIQKFVIKKYLGREYKKYPTYCIDIFDIQQVEEVILDIFKREEIPFLPTEFYYDNKNNFRERYLSKIIMNNEKGTNIAFKFK